MNKTFCEDCADFGKCNQNDCPYFEDEQAELEEKAKKMPRKYEKSGKTAQKKPKTVKISQEKQDLFDLLYEGLSNYYENVQIIKQNKLISVQINEKILKIDVIEKRPPK